MTLYRDRWPCPSIFAWLQRLGTIDDGEMERVFNMGIGIVLLVSPFYAAHICRMVNAMGLECWEIGDVAPGPQRVVMR